MRNYNLCKLKTNLQPERVEMLSLKILQNYIGWAKLHRQTPDFDRTNLNDQDTVVANWTFWVRIPFKWHHFHQKLMLFKWINGTSKGNKAKDRTIAVGMTSTIASMRIGIKWSNNFWFYIACLTNFCQLHCGNEETVHGLWWIIFNCNTCWCK